METRINFEEWLKTNVPRRCVDIVKDELMTFVRIKGLNYLSQTVAAFKSSLQMSEMRDCQFKGDRIIIAYANDWSKAISE